MKIDEKYSVTTDRYNWIVTETYTGKDKDGNDKPHQRDHFFPNLGSCVSWLIQNECSKKDSLADIKKELERAERICKAVLGNVQQSEI